MQLLEPGLHVAAVTVDRIDCRGRLAEIGHDKAGIPPREPDNLRLDAHAPPMRPTPGRVAGPARDVLRAAAELGEPVGVAQQAPRLRTSRTGPASSTTVPRSVRRKTNFESSGDSRIVAMPCGQKSNLSAMIVLLLRSWGRMQVLHQGCLADVQLTQRSIVAIMRSV
jgi:hypothetical protein